MSNWLPSLAVVLFTAACAANPGQPFVAAPAAGDEPTLRAGDVLRVHVWPNESLGGEFVVEGSGSVYIPTLGEVRILGRTIEAVKAQIREHYSTEMRLPAVTITPVYRVSVLGAVQRPGLYPVDPTYTIFDVVSLAGGFRQDAKPSELKVVRGESVIQLNAEQALQSGESGMALQLRSGDRIVVPERSGFFSLNNLRLLIQSTTFVFTIINFIRG